MRTIPMTTTAATLAAALLLAGCGGENGTNEPADQAAAEADTDEASDADTPEAPAAEPGIGPANGTMTLDGEEFELASVVQCPPREMFNDGQYDSAEILIDLRAGTEDRLNAVRVMERHIDGVTSHRISDGSGSIASEYMVEEGEPGFPIFEIEGDVITADGQISPAGTEDPTLITATWDIPEGFAGEINC